jgi:hypothetical protein
MEDRTVDVQEEDGHSSFTLGTGHESILESPEEVYFRIWVIVTIAKTKNSAISLFIMERRVVRIYSLILSCFFSESRSVTYNPWKHILNMLCLILLT